MVPGFQLFGSERDDNFIDMTNPKTRSRLKPTKEIMREVRDNTQARNLGEFRGGNILGSVGRASNTPLRTAVIRGQEQKEKLERINQEQERVNQEQQIIVDAKAGMNADQIAARRAALLRVKSDAVQMRDSVLSRQARFDVGKSVGQAAGVGMRQQVDFSQEQQMLGQMFGGGEKIWGTDMTPVRINNDLNSSRSDPYDETAGMFGFGGGGERSGLF